MSTAIENEERKCAACEGFVNRNHSIECKRAQEREAMKKLISRYRNGIGHRECKDLTGHPDAMPSQRKDWRCPLCKQADKYAQPPTRRQP